MIAYTLVPSPLHHRDDHPENRRRFQHFDRIAGLPFADRLLELTPAPATREQVLRVHTAEFVNGLEAAMERAPAYIDYAPTYITPASFDGALLAAGGLIGVVEAVMEGRAESGFALVRPPGHHATPDRAMGFCLLNNAGIAARHLQALGVERVLIVDFDVHHGNGTQAAFYSDPHVLFISTHQHGIYPRTGALREVGEGPGEGFTMNVPLPAGAGDRAFVRLMEEVIRPRAERFRPDFLLVSAGFDAHWSDPLASLQLTTTGFFGLAASLRDLSDRLCPGRLALTLEGGYDPRALRDNVLAVFHALARWEGAPDDLGPAPYPEPDISLLIRELRATHLA